MHVYVCAAGGMCKAEWLGCFVHWYMMYAACAISINKLLTHGALRAFCVRGTGSVRSAFPWIVRTLVTTTEQSIQCDNSQFCDTADVNETIL